MLLGHSGLALRFDCINARMQVMWKEKNSVQHLWVLFQPIGIVGAPPYRRTSIIKPSGNTRIAYAFVTFTLPYFSELHKKRYKQVNGKNVRIIPANIADLLTPRAIAWGPKGPRCGPKGDPKFPATSK
jgi:LAGLIDADG DNA endonuclease family